MKTKIKIALIAILAMSLEVKSQEKVTTENGAKTDFVYVYGNVGIGTTNPLVKLQVEGSPANNIVGTEEIFKMGRALTNNTSFQQAASFKLGRYTTTDKAYESFTRFDIALKGNTPASDYLTDVTVMTLQNNGNVGIGTSTPSEKLNVNGNIKITGDLKMSGTDSYIWTNGTGTGYTGIWDQKNNRVLFYASEADGNVGIGTTNTKGFKLGVNGNIIATEMKVANYADWADFVFSDTYKLATLAEVEKHIKQKGHLKDIPSAKEVEKDGFFLGEMDAKLLQKIEELTLYTIEQEKKIKSLENQVKEIEGLKKQNSKIEKQEKEIEKLKFLVQKLIKDKN